MIETQTTSTTPRVVTPGGGATTVAPDDATDSAPASSVAASSPSSSEWSFSPLTEPEGGLRPCNEVIEMVFAGNILPKEVILTTLNGMVDSMFDFTDENQASIAADVKAQIESLVTYSVRARKVCTSCEEANAIWEKTHTEVSASEVMPYCMDGKFAYGRTIGGLVLEPIDLVTGDIISGNIAASFWTDITETNPFFAASQVWPYDFSAVLPQKLSFGAMASASAGTVSFVPDVLGLGEDWQNPRSYVVKEVYQASSIPLLLKVQNDYLETDSCTRLDKRIAISGYSEGGYAAISTADAVERLDDGYINTFLGIGGAPIKLSTEQMRAVVEMADGVYPFPAFSVRFANAYSSTNGDLVNSGLGQDYASDEYMNPDDETKNIKTWIEYGLTYEEMVPLIPTNSSLVVNPDILNMIVSSFETNNTDPCNSDFAPVSLDKACEAVKANDLLATVESFEFPVTFCHSPNDEIVFYSNLPNVSAFENFNMIEDLPGVGDIANPQGSHYESFPVCLLGFMFPFIAPPDEGIIRQITLVNDEACGSPANGTDVPTVAPGGEPSQSSFPTSYTPTESSAYHSFGGSITLVILFVTIISGITW